MDGCFARPRFSFACGNMSIGIPTNPAACIAAPRAPARRYCAAWRRGCPAARATAPDAARDRARGAGSRPLRRGSGTAGGTPCASNSATTRTRRNSGAAATPFSTARRRAYSIALSFGLGFMPALSMADSTARFWSVVLFGVFHGQSSPVIAARSCGRVLSCARSRMDRALAKMLSRQARNRSGPGKGQGWGLSFGLRYASFARSKLRKINEGSGTPANAG